MPAQVINISEACERLARTKAWDAEVSRLRFATKTRGEILERMGLVSVRDVLMHVPHRYMDFTKLTQIAFAEIGSEATIVGTVDRVKLKRPKPKLSITEVSLIDETGVLMCSFFKQPWLAEQLRKGDIIAVSGKVAMPYKYKQLTPQFYEVISKAQDSDGEPQDLGTARKYARVLPLHHLSEGLSAAWMRRIESAAIADYGDVIDFMPAHLIAKHHLMTEARALREVHFPSSMAAAKRARKRLAYDEVLSLQVALLSRQAIELEGITPHQHTVDGPLKRALINALPFELSQEQARATEEILSDMAAARPMNRLLLGDVGTGKTAVAAVCMAAAADSGTQVAVMAPTSVLAHQYAEKLGPLFDEVGISWALVTGATIGTERETIAQKVVQGQITVVFGTTAVLSDDIEFSDLSLVIMDEQHRFGVHQRTALRGKGEAADQLVMTATPIPRTLALTAYGDLSSSLIRTRPHKTAGVTTKLLTPENVDIAHTAIAEALAKGQQAYVVCPLVDDSDDGSELDDVPESERTQAALHSALTTYKRLQERVFKDARVGLIHGRMKAQEKDEVMSAFRAGEIQILVSTTVIEVGVDVPNATVMLIWDADRFGLATLHQLRGRVGRGKTSGEVYLVSSARGRSVAAKRLGVLEKTSDGLELAEMDLRLRHEGEVLGIRQSGGVTLKITDLIEDAELIEQAHRDAQELVAKDPSLSSTLNKPFGHEVTGRFGAYFEGERNR